jgi:ABC-type multidrug transport system fused ATPase/permease subunit
MTTATGENPLIDQAIDKLKEIDDKVRELFDKVNEVMSWVPSILSNLIEPVQRVMNQLNQKINEFWDVCEKFSTERGNPDRLKQVAAEWSSHIGDVVSGIAGTVSLDKLKTAIDWTGKGAETYKSTVPAQVGGLNSLKDLALQMRNSLTDLANGIDGFWKQILGILIGLGIALVVAILSALTVVGIPAAIAILVGMIGAGIASIFTTISAVDSLTGTISNEQTAIHDKVVALGSTWSATDTSTMSQSSDWHVQ